VSTFSGTLFAWRVLLFAFLNQTFFDSWADNEADPMLTGVVE